MIKKLLFALLGLVVIVAVLAGLKYLQISALIASAPTGGPPPEAVAIREVRADVWEAKIAAVGSLSSFQGVLIVAEAEGVVRTIAFEAGSEVKAGDELVELDVDIERAQLRAAEAGVDLARSDLKRAEDLFATRTISRAELDAAQASLKQAQAQMENLQAVVRRKTIRAPFTGRLGIRQVNLGQFLNKGEGVVSLQALDPVFVEFAVPQQRLPLMKEGLEVRVTIDAFPERSFTGRLTAINPDIDRSSRSLRVQATLPNPEALLRPGMYANVEVILPEKRNVLIIPLTAVLYATFGDSVFVVEDGEPLPDGSRPLVARQQLVRMGETQGDFVVVTAGLKEGQRVVTAGAFKLRNGARVAESTVGVVEPRLNPRLPNT